MRTILNTLAAILGVGMLLAGGALIYALLTPWVIISQLSVLLLALLVEVLLGSAVGLLLRSWRAVALAPLGYGAGFLGVAALQGLGLATGVFAGAEGERAQVAGIAGGSFALALVFVLALLCCLLALGTMLGTRAGIRLQKRFQRNARRRAEGRAALALLRDAASTQQITPRLVAPARRERVPA